MRLYEELDDEHWSIRHVELNGKGAVVAAASLDEWMAARDSGASWALGLYRALYGVLPEGPFPPGSSDLGQGKVSADTLTTFGTADGLRER